MALSLHHAKRGGDLAASDAITASGAIAAPDGAAGLNTAEWLSLAAAADGSAVKPPVPAAQRTARGGQTVLTADFLSFAAAPTFALMGLLTAATGSSDMICMTTPDAFPLTGMTSMYLLMSGFHLSPWLRLAGRRAPTLKRASS
ncbi:hypothetical protein FHS26_006579 [Rhizobium pisi]|uniref:Uncharacterized protein n=1 Tax=Rhizobium pisi TaxID=574561 RepID=A0A3R9B0A3_9HYPH|nr:hypothetical protein [Rhizobium pisi]MBB3138800.1 hypothetical protein [Rhizobium pisi]RSB61475.1 hypothetical protein EFD55_30605 [Rhizobium pisi]TCA43961.1 hypothetical protein E0J16_31540 [Rhizobium pisi]